MFSRLSWSFHNVAVVGNLLNGHKGCWERMVNVEPLHSVADARAAALDTDFQGQKVLKIGCSHRGKQGNTERTVMHLSSTKQFAIISRTWSIRVEKSLGHHGGLEMLQTDAEKTGDHRNSSPSHTFSDQ